MKYIFKFIDKVRASPHPLSSPPDRRAPGRLQEKQAESIVEKLCQRFRLSEDPRQWRDIAFCLSLLPFKSDRSVKKLIEGLQYYRDKLREEEVYLRFQDILTKVRTHSSREEACNAHCFVLQARQNKSANKPDGELNEFEQVCLSHSFIPVVRR